MLMEVDPDRLGQILGIVTGLVAAGVLEAAPVRCWDVRRAAEALRFMSQARHTGKIVLTVPPDPAAPREPGTALVTGGTGTLGARVASAPGRDPGRRRSCCSRAGPGPPGRHRRARRGPGGRRTGVRVAACDAADRDALAAVLAGIPEGCPLTRVVRGPAWSTTG